MKDLKYNIFLIKREYKNANGRVMYTAEAKVIYGSTKDYDITKRFANRSLRLIKLPCEICHRSTKITRHHLVPVSTYKPIGEAIAAGKYVRSRDRKIAFVCKDCHIDIHRRFTNEELADEYDTIPKLRDAIMGEQIKIQVKESIAKHASQNLKGVVV